MAKITKTSKNKRKKKTKGGIFRRINLGESYTSLMLGGIVVLVIALLFMSFARGSKSGEISFIDDVPEINEQLSGNLNASSTYTIKPGDDLWTISENIYNNGYKWIEIAKINKLENPGLIYAGSKLIIPNEKFTEAESPIIQSGSITGNVYKIKAGDNLWNIAVRAYGDGFKWPEIAKANYLQNPGLIHSDNILKIPR